MFGNAQTDAPGEMILLAPPDTRYHLRHFVLYDFLTAQRSALIELCRMKVARRRVPEAAEGELEHGIPIFLEQLIKTLRVGSGLEPNESRKISGPSSGGNSASSEIGGSAAQHGRDLFKRGFTVDQVVHDYGDLCQAITELAHQHGEPVSAAEFQTLNRCLDNAIADAVTEFAYARETEIAANSVASTNERMGFLAHELRNLIHTASLGFSAIKTGRVGSTGTTGALVDRSLAGLTRLIDRTLSDVRDSTLVAAPTSLLSVADFVTEIKLSAALEAHVRDCQLAVSAVDPRLGVVIDRDSLVSAVGNLLQNAFKFTAPRSVVSLNAYGIADRVRIDVEDRCGGLPPDLEHTMFLPFTQGAVDKSGLGLGLSICRQIVEANRGSLSVRDVPGLGYVFTIDLPRYTLSSAAVAAPLVGAAAGDGVAASVNA